MSRVLEAPGPVDRLLLSSREAARMLSLSERKLWELTDRGLIPAIRIGRAKRYCVRQLVAWVDEQRSRSNGEYCE